MVAVAASVLCMGQASCLKIGDDLSKVPEPPRVEIPVLTREVHNLRYNVTLKLPDDWEVSEKAENPVFFAVAPGSGPNGPLANLVVESFTKHLDAYE